MKKWINWPILAAVLMTPAHVSAQKVEGVDVTSWLDRIDRIEEKYLNDEEGTLSFDDKSKRSYPPTDPKDIEVHSFSSQKIVGAAPHDADFREHAAAITKLEYQVANLEKEVLSTKQKVIERSNIDNYVKIQSWIGNTDGAALRSLTIKLDGFTVYSLGQSAGLWLPSKVLPVYSGPLRPGDHRLDVQAVAVLRKRDGMPLNDGAFREATRSLSFRIPEGAHRQVVDLHIEPPKNADDPIQISMKDTP